MVHAMCMAVVSMFAAAVVQANPCSSGGECPSSSKHQNVVSLLQTKLRMNELEDGPLMMKNPSAMLTEFEGMVRSGEAPTHELVSSIKDIIENHIMPGLQDTREASAQDTVDALSYIESCHNNSKVKEGKIREEEETDVNNTRSEHADCREAEMCLHHHNLTGSISFTQGQPFNSDSYCVRLGDFLHAAARLEIPAGSARGDSVQYVKWAAATNMCDSSHVTELDNGCSAQESTLAAKKAECGLKQGIFERTFCAWKSALESNCADLDTCHSAAVTAYNTHVAARRILEDKWNVETAALKKIHCHCNVWLSGIHDPSHGDGRSLHNATHFEVCKLQTHTPDPVNYGTPAVKIPCLLTDVEDHPGTSGFLTQEYSSFTDFVEPVSPCEEGTTAAPTTVEP